MSTRLFAFVGGDIGLWRIVRTETIVGEPLPEAKRLNVVSGSDVQPETNAPWVLRGITSNERYVARSEKSEIVAKQQGLARPEATCAALIPIRKNADWWELTQDERRSVFEEQSKHIQIGLKYLPAVARRLHHCRDLSENEPFDFLNWFEYAPIHEVEFNRLLSELRASEEWKYVAREVDIRLMREDV
ncbi:chlorite dismutase family protein [Marinobacter sp. LV10MA510-1]|uniref:chlorite dismutase family protein n=1 Tax=Marinobacter sp. LV10MA510-1 TaxID=1415567 RepID=UPI000BF46E5E|nr:chlorite dismutase family protein [Marinobacter sp. LV10MA510-1]PFG10694.1 chlorite dismutase [Marinobacter sp. LV10MA510-1]